MVSTAITTHLRRLIEEKILEETLSVEVKLKLKLIFASAKKGEKLQFEALLGRKRRRGTSGGDISVSIGTECCIWISV